MPEVHDLAGRDVDVHPCSIGAYLRLVAQQQDFGQTFTCDFRRRTQNPRIFRLGEDDALGVPPAHLVHIVQELFGGLSVSLWIAELDGYDFLHVDMLFEKSSRPLYFRG